MRGMKKYTLTKKRDGERFGRVIESGLTLREARAELLDLFNREFGTMYSHWGLAVNATRHKVDGACRTFSDGTRTFSYDVYTYCIEEEMYNE